MAAYGSSPHCAYSAVILVAAAPQPCLISGSGCAAASIWGTELGDASMAWRSHDVSPCAACPLLLRPRAAPSACPNARLQGRRSAACDHVSSRMVRPASQPCSAVPVTGCARWPCLASAGPRSLPRRSRVVRNTQRAAAPRMSERQRRARRCGARWSGARRRPRLTNGSGVRSASGLLRIWNVRHAGGRPSPAARPRPRAARPAGAESARPAPRCPARSR